MLSNVATKFQDLQVRFADGASTPAQNDEAYDILQRARLADWLHQALFAPALIAFKKQLVQPS